MSKDRVESIVAGVVALVLGIILIILGLAINDKLWFTASMLICGIWFADCALVYLAKIFKRGH